MLHFKVEAKWPKSLCHYNLTLTGDEPSDESIELIREDDERTEFELISYQKHISRWLHQCIQNSASLPAIRESLIQYRSIVQDLTTHSLGDIPVAFIQTLQSIEHLQAAEQIASALPAAKAMAIAPFWNEVEKRVTANGLSIIDEDDSYSAERLYDQFSGKKPGQADASLSVHPRGVECNAISELATGIGWDQEGLFCYWGIMEGDEYMTTKKVMSSGQFNEQCTQLALKEEGENSWESRVGLFVKRLPIARGISLTSYVNWVAENKGSASTEDFLTNTAREAVIESAELLNKVCEAFSAKLEFDLG